MDTGRGTFELANSFEELQEKTGKEFTPESDGIFSVGEVLTIKGSRFKVKEIKKRGRFVLKLLPKE